jgi:hypothetical protein
MGIPQVLVNYNPVGRGRWRLKPFIDHKGHPVTSNFNTVRPISASWSLEYLWAICFSPLANAYVYTHCLKRHIHAGDLRRLPVPNVGSENTRRVERAARDYLEAAEEGFPTLFSRGVSEADLRMRLLRVDAEVLRLYGLPARAERRLLDSFAGEQRPGVPIPFIRYYPDHFNANLPLYAYLSDSFQRKLNDGDPSLPATIEARYEQLMERSEAGTLSADELDELNHLQAEVDGRDYAFQIPDDSWLEEADQRQRESDVALGALATQAIDATLRGASDHED